MVLNNNYEVILFDLMMFGKDGIEVCCELREFKFIFVVMLIVKGEEVNWV